MATSPKTLTKHVLLFVFGLQLAWTLESSRTVGWYVEAPRPWPSHVTSRMPHEYISPGDLPANYDWRSVNGRSLVSEVSNQFLPYPCGSCWAHASTGALTDRMIIATKGAQPIVRLSPQVLLDCGTDSQAGGCEGGSDILAYKFIQENGITDVTCSPYMGVEFTNWAEIPCPERMCRNCDTKGVCQFVQGPKHYVSEYGNLTGEDQMKAEIYARGPIACSIYAHGESFLNYTSGIIRDPTHYDHTTHVVAITGWGVDSDGSKYWVGRNSFGTSWGMQGWFKLERGTNCLLIEEHPCAWAVPAMNKTIHT